MIGVNQIFCLKVCDFSAVVLPITLCLCRRYNRCGADKATGLLNFANFRQSSSVVKPKVIVFMRMEGNGRRI